MSCNGRFTAHLDLSEKVKSRKRLKSFVRLQRDKKYPSVLMFSRFANNIQTHGRAGEKGPCRNLSEFGSRHTDWPPYDWKTPCRPFVLDLQTTQSADVRKEKGPGGNVFVALQTTHGHG